MLYVPPSAILSGSRNVRKMLMAAERSPGIGPSEKVPTQLYASCFVPIKLVIVSQHRFTTLAS